MRTVAVGSRAVARLAVAGLAAGLLALGGLALWTTIGIERANAHERELNEISERWGEVLQQTDVENDALRDFLRAGTADGRKPLASTLGLAVTNLDWLRHHGEATDAAAATQVRPTYNSYTDSLKQIVSLGNRGETSKMEQQAELAEFAASSLRKQIASVVAAKRHETTDFLDAQDRANYQLRLAASVASLVDLGLLALCTVVLLDNQRRLRQQAAQSEHDALHDALTGLGNRLLLADRMEHGVRESARYGEPFALLMIDMNNFKQVNDTLGHHVGDLLLARVADRLREAVREIDLVARLGGDEFAVLLPRVGSVDNAMMVARRIHQALCTPARLDDLDLDLDVSASIGLAVCPVDAVDAEQLLRHADIAMYTAKRGRLGVTRYEPDIDDAGPPPLPPDSDRQLATQHHELRSVAAARGQGRGGR